MTHVDVRYDWDSDEISILKLFEVVDDYMIVIYQKSISAVRVVSDRDFLEKKLIIRDKDTYYVLVTSVPDSMKESEGDAVRATTIAGFYTYKLLEDGNILY